MATGMEQGGHGERHLTSASGAGRSRRSNWRTALILVSIALVFFAGVIVNRLLFN